MHLSHLDWSIGINNDDCFQISHTLHLSAVSPSYYRFHVEHLQSDDYSKDKVSMNHHKATIM